MIDLERRVTFGRKFRGKPLNQCPTPFLRWVCQQPWICEDTRLAATAIRLQRQPAARDMEPARDE